jgi:hypothetical protein
VHCTSEHAPLLSPERNRRYESDITLIDAIRSLSVEAECSYYPGRCTEVGYRAQQLAAISQVGIWRIRGVVVTSTELTEQREELAPSQYLPKAHGPGIKTGNPTGEMG